MISCFLNFAGHSRNTKLEVIEDMQTTRFIVNPEDIRPFPKAPQRVANGRRKGKSAELTSTPVKDELEALQQNTSAKKKKVSKEEKQKVKKKLPNSENVKTDYFCLYCTEPYSNSRPKEKWIQCTKCNLWAHEECTAGEIYEFVCVHCE